MIEVEIKLPIEERESVTVNLEKMGFIKAGLVQEEDVYFDNDFGQIAKMEKLFVFVESPIF